MADRPFITAFDGYTPRIANDAFVDVSARVIGRVEIKPRATIWPGAVLRADEAEIVIGEGAAVLDLALVESPEGRPVAVGDGALISHQACIHGATVEPGALVGVGAIVLDGAVIREGALVGAGAVVPPGAEVPAGMLVLGQPAKPIRPLSPAERQNTADQLAQLQRKAVRY